MKKSSIALFVAAALFLVCSFTFLPDGIGEFASGVAVAVVLALVGYFKEKKARKAAAEARLKQDVTITIDCFEDNEKIYNAEARVVYTK